MGDKQGLTQDDFRKLLLTPRAERLGNQTPRAGGGIGNNQGVQKSAKPRPKPKPKPKEGEDDDGDDGPKYRDRAEERRRGFNPDYASSSLLVSGGATGGMTPLLGSNTVDVSRLSVEESKFLGGDMEFTHLVKGLDFALLQKERSKQQFIPRGVAMEAGPGQGPGGVSRGGDEAPSSSVGGHFKEEDVKFNGPLARNVFSLLFKPPKANISELFLPKRLAFSYNLSGDDEDECLLDGISSDLPTLLRRSKAECPPVESTLFSFLDDHLMDRIQRVMSYLHAGGKKMKRKEKEEVGAGAGAGELMKKKGLGAEAAVAAGDVSITSLTKASTSNAKPAKAKAPQDEDDDDDIFGDAGTDYKPSVSKKKEEGGPGGLSSVAVKGGDGKSLGGTYFEGKDHLLPTLPDAEDEPHAMDRTDSGKNEEKYEYSTRPQANEQGGPIAGAADATGAGEKWRVKAGKVEEKHVDFEEAAYGECYPMQAGFAGEIVDSDNEDGKVQDPVADPAGAKGKGGGKGKGGSTANKEAGEAKVKINHQLTQIEKIFKDKGQDHSLAFKGAEGAKAEGKGGKRGGEGFEPGIDPNLMTPARGKKQRI